MVAGRPPGSDARSLSRVLSTKAGEICQPWSMTHASMPEEARVAAGITPSIFRLSVGLEDPKDLIADLDTAFKAATKASVTA